LRDLRRESNRPRATLSALRLVSRSANRNQTLALLLMRKAVVSESEGSLKMITAQEAITILASWKGRVQYVYKSADDIAELIRHQQGQTNRLHDILACALKQCEKGSRCAYDDSERSGCDMVVSMIRSYERDTFPANTKANQLPANAKLRSDLGQTDTSCLCSNDEIPWHNNPECPLANDHNQDPPGFEQKL